ncbi:ubiquinone biosynthesis accessory factor UbiJ [Teredinibacter waterburyi]|uniref:ubiquinone biosynthesis accessory factor UbiJ n=1 Tax=Teredinibacter waterburyi TaxID=1500538 RepID=UPI00165F5BEB|nr:SCP2 sterol-binding domain-containing protein [Teredinibacter waterburyi]
MAADDVTADHDPTYVTALAAVLEKIVNTALTYDPATKVGLQKLENHVLAVQITEPQLKLYFVVLADQLDVMAHCETPVATLLQGSLQDLIKLASQPSTSLANSGVRVEGQIGLLSEYQQVLSQLDIDWEDALASRLGDLPAHQIAQALRAATNWIKPRSRKAASFTADFLTEELRVLPHKLEVDQYVQQVDQLREASDRLEARLQRLLLQQAQQQQ